MFSWHPITNINFLFAFNMPSGSGFSMDYRKILSNNKSDWEKKKKFVLEMVENIQRKGENAGNQHFLLFPKYFLTASFSRSLKVQIDWYRVDQDVMFVFQFKEMLTWPHIMDKISGLCGKRVTRQDSYHKIPDTSKY